MMRRGHTLIVRGRLGSIHFVQLLQRLLFGQVGVGVALAQCFLASTSLIGSSACFLVEFSQFPLFVLLSTPQSHRYRIFRTHVGTPLGLPLGCQPAGVHT